EDKLGVVISLPTFYEASIVGLAARILTCATNESSDAELGFNFAGSKAGVHPLSYGQRSLWFLHQLAPESPAYNLANAVRIRSELSVPAMRSAFQRLVDRHACLRTTFGVLPDGSPSQNIHSEVDVCFQEVNALAYSEDELYHHLTLEAHRPFSLDQGP